MNFKHLHIDELLSTHDKLWELASQENLPEFYTLSAGFQKNGRGQDSKQWESKKDENIVLSTLLFPKFLLAEDIFQISRCVSLAVINYLKEKKLKGLSIKWPNDIYVGKRKIAGILIQNVISGHHIEKSMLSIGLNINQECFDSDAPNPISLKQITHHNYNIQSEIGLLIQHIAKQYTFLQNDPLDLLSRYHQNLYQLEKWKKYSDENQIFTARIKGVDSFGRLILEKKDAGTEVYDIKQISLILE